MKAIKSAFENYGPFEAVEILEDRYRGDNTEYPFTVVGQCEIVDADTITWPEPSVPVKTLEQLKTERAALVDAIKVTTIAGNTFDGDETSQTRMARAIIALTAAGGTVNWVLADNSIVEVGSAELTEALALAGAAQATIWVAPYETPAA